MATPTAAETTVIGIDTGFFLYGNHPFVKAQMEAIKHYAHVKLQCNPKNRVGIYRMTAGYDGFELSPTNNLKEILRCVEGLASASHCGGVVDFQVAVKDILAFPGWLSSNTKKRLLVFVGTSINLRMEDVRPVGLMLKEKDIILNVVNFFVLEEDMLRLYNRVPREKFQYKREELAELVTIVNGKDDSQLVDVDVEESSVCDILSKTILKNNLRYLRKKNDKNKKR